ncbi:MAG: glycosyltransferase family 1 protein [Asgard group archaeon]|nr:glycosyltransferase family 1 protein [Asgard group archaeon]
MVITILTGGTRGDTQPYIALGLALKKEGYKIRIATFENYESFVKNYGLDFYPIKGDVKEVATSNIMDSAMQADNPLKFIFSFRKLRSLVFNLQDDFYNACQGSEAIVYHPGVTMGFFAAQQLRIPSILAIPFPMTPTTEFPSIIFYNRPSLGKQYNRLTHELIERTMWFGSKAAVRRFWKKKFGRRPKNFRNPFKKQTTKDFPTIVSCSQHVFPKPKDWSEHVHNTGYWFLDEEKDWKASKELQAFLKAGNPPIYVGFGSVKDAKTAVKTSNIVIDALKRNNMRGILATGWKSMMMDNDNQEDFFILESVPHSWLFPQMAAVVHHGGAGTTGATLRAGIPNIIIPYSNDQFGWGRRIFELGVGPKLIPRKKLTTEKLAKAIKLSQSKEIIDAANQLGIKIDKENGAKKAAKIISSTLNNN